MRQFILPSTQGQSDGDGGDSGTQVFLAFATEETVDRVTLYGAFENIPENQGARSNPIDPINDYTYTWTAEDEIAFVFGGA